MMILLADRSLGQVGQVGQIGQFWPVEIAKYGKKVGIYAVSMLNRLNMHFFSMISDSFEANRTLNYQIVQYGYVLMPA